MKNELMVKMANEGHSIREISKTLKVSFTTVRYWLGKMNIKTSGHNKKNNWSFDRVNEAVLNSYCKSDVLRYLGISLKSGNFQTLDKYLIKYNIDSSNLVYDNKRGNRFKTKYTHSDIFCENSKVNRNTLKSNIDKDKLLEYKCSECGLDSIWNGKKINLQLDHINGINNDNRLENLRYLCPNCHSQTETYCNKKR